MNEIKFEQGGVEGISGKEHIANLEAENAHLKYILSVIRDNGLADRVANTCPHPKNNNTRWKERLRVINDYRTRLLGVMGEALVAKGGKV